MQPVNNNPGANQSNDTNQANQASQADMNDLLQQLGFNQNDFLAHVVQALAVPTLDSPVRPTRSLQPRSGQAQAHENQHFTHLNQTNNIFMTPVSGVSFVQNSGTNVGNTGQAGLQPSPASAPRNLPDDATYNHYGKMARAVFGEDLDGALDETEPLFSERLIPTPPIESDQSGTSPERNSDQPQQASASKKRKASSLGATMSMNIGGREMTGMAFPPSLPSGFIDRTGRVGPPPQPFIGPIQHHIAGVEQPSVVRSAQAQGQTPQAARATRALPPRPVFPNEMLANQPGPLGPPPKLPRIDNSSDLDRKPPGRPKEG